MYIALSSIHALILCGLQFISCVRGQWTECSDFSPPITVILLVFLCLEGLLFFTFTAVMFGTQIHSICNDETVSLVLYLQGAAWGAVSSNSPGVRVASPTLGPQACVCYSLHWGSRVSGPRIGLS